MGPKKRKQTYARILRRRHNEGHEGEKDRVEEKGTFLILGNKYTWYGPGSKFFFFFNHGL